MLEVIYNSEKWGSIFLKVAPQLGEKNTLEIVLQAVDMFLGHKTKKKIKGPDYTGIITTTKTYRVLGIYHGVEYCATIEDAHGTAELSFLLRDLPNPRLN